MILDTVAHVYHLTQDTSDADKEQYQLDAGLTGVAMNIQPAAIDETVIVDGAFGKTYSAYTTQSGIRIGDKVTVSGTGQIFRVRGRGDWSTPDLAPHYEYTFVEFEDDELM